ncbi:hypothetical protein Aduo_005900 [Ancylostoma duodenale]
MVEVIGLLSIPGVDISEGLNKGLSTTMGLRQIVATLKSTHGPSISKKPRLARRSELPAVGRMPNPAPIRLSKVTTEPQLHSTALFIGTKKETLDDTLGAQAP